MDKSVSAIYRVDDSTGLALPLFEYALPAGFPSPADDHVENRIDLNQDMILHADATYYARISGESMIGEGIFDNDIVAFDRVLPAHDRDVVVACINSEEFCCKIFRDGHDDSGRIRLEPANPEYTVIRFTLGMELQIIGLVTFSVHWHAKRYGRHLRLNRLQ
jgi:DNA polymerase V